MCQLRSVVSCLSTMGAITVATAGALSCSVGNIKYFIIFSFYIAADIVISI